VIEIASIAGLAMVQDAGRPGRMHQGVPAGGALVPELFARANAAAQNAARDAAIEVFGAITVLARSPVKVAGDDGAARHLAVGESWTIALAGARVRYLAIRGGVEVPIVQGGRGTLLVAGFGGMDGRALRRGDRLAAGRSPPTSFEPPLAPGPDRPIRVIAGPDADRFPPATLEALIQATWRVSPRSDRIGLRLDGPPLPRSDADTGESAPMVPGAIQVPASGEPIVLGPDHPTTGGYPVVATVVRADWGALMARAVGAVVRFEAA
jgi:5-oxoprolinase (ATP-hydrolysing) subunit C